ncbi:TolC family outer membrane protein [Marinobacterium sediminicola]|uniref:Outer membrane protein, adhesin transport system n=1 Tax=Marinobacterium sediminicola TaxID=518898 RepID=A0ABY1RXT2_9GAMM|nr:TolC family outer membrane protein [Marinobacterium sediminicola]ULG68589.1 TolC family outer membrane protein [Marinobacterium sediminicola]SMR73107.1 outer membrane protein, adhesin transport system [Marinobacterium sediminicola]
MKFKQSVLAVTLSIGFSGWASAATLQEVVVDNIGQNPQVQQALQNYAAVIQEIRQAKAGYYPTLDATLGYGYEWTEKGNSDDVELNRREARLNLNQMIFDGFATRSEVQRQQARAASRASNYKDTAQRYVLAASRAYLEVQRREQLLQLAKESLYNHVKLYDQIRRRSESGMGTLASLQQAEGRLALAEVNMLAADNNLRDAQANYRRVVGQSVPESLEPFDSSVLKLPATLEEAVAKGLANQPVASLAEADVEAAVAQRDAAKSRMYPRLDFEVERRWDDNIDGNPGSDEDLTAMLRLRYNLYNGGADKARIRQTEHQIGEAQAIQRDAQLQIRESVELSWNAYEILQRQLEYLEKHVRSSEDTRDSYKKQFDIGQRSLLDLLDTENEVFSAKNQLAEARVDSEIAKLRILTGTGELLEALKVELPPVEESEPMPEQVAASGQ